MNGYWKIRFDLLDDAPAYLPYLEKISSLCDRAVFYYHPDGKTDGKLPHIHGLLLNYKGGIDDTLRSNTKKHFRLTTKDSCTVSQTFKKGTKMTEFTYPGYIVYMSKGKYDPVYSKNVSEQETDLAKSLWKEPKKDATTIVIEPREKVQKKLTQFQCAKEVEIRYLEQTQDEDFTDIDKLIEITSKTLSDNHSLAHYRVCANIIQDIQSRQNKTVYNSAVKKLLNF